KSLEEDLSGKHPGEFIEKISAGLELFKDNDVDFVVFPCNTFHYFRNFFQKSSKIRILDMIDITSNYIIQQYPYAKKVALLSTVATAKAGMYQKALEIKGVITILPNYETQEKVNFLIEQSMLGLASAKETRKALAEVIKTMSESGVNCIILGCTEIPEVAKHDRYDIPLIDTTFILVKNIVSEIKKPDFFKNNNCPFFKRTGCEINALQEILTAPKSKL
ncbi:MAG: amino acid racemase, partial [Gammaproteobacteria bacterium]|nr:amino acid racemase [Gammaproteobacteria bacterium]